MSKNPNTETVLNKLDHAERMALLDPADPKYSKTRSGIETAVAQAKLEVVGLRIKYAEAVLNSGVAIFLSGPENRTEEFCKLISELGEAVVVDANEVYNYISRPLEATLSSTRTFTSEVASVLISQVAATARLVGVGLNRPIRADTQKHVATYKDLVNHVRDIVRSELGDVLAAAYLKTVVGREALKIRYMVDVSPVIVLNATAEEVVGLGHAFGKGQATVELKEEDKVDSEFVGKVFANVQKQLKKK